MATSKLIAKAAKYGARSRNDYIASATDHIYVGKRASDSGTYYARLTMPALSSVSQIGSNRINVTGARLYLKLNGSEGSATTITVVGSTSSAYSATGTSLTFSCSTGSGWKSVDITSIVTAMAERTSDWYIHLRATGTLKRFDGTSRSGPYMNVDWEFVANTLRSSAASVALGSSVTFTIAPETGDASYTLTASIGDATQTIATKGTATSYVWTPPVNLAGEITNATSGSVTISMIVYDANGKEKRREVLYQTVTVPTATVKPTASGIQTVLTRGFNGAILTGETDISVVPSASTVDDYGADIVNMTVSAVNGSKSMTLSWSPSEMTGEPSAVKGASKTIPRSFCASGGTLNLTLTATDTRGTTASTSASLTVYAYSRPVITAFAVDRYGPVYDANEQVSGYQQDDVGDHVWVTAAARISDVAGKNSLKWTIAGSNGTSKSGTAGTSMSLNIDRTLFPGAVGADMNVQYTLTVTDTAGNTAAAYSEVVPGRANFSLAGSKHGVGVGCIARGTAANPLFEVAYPSRFYESVHTLGVYGADGGRLDIPRAYMFAAEDYGANFQPSTSAYRLHVFRSGAMVTLTGAWLVKTACTGLQTIVTLPDWAKPCMPTDAIQIVQGYKLMDVRTNPDGIIQARYLSDIGTVGTFPAGQSMNVMMTWIAADAFALERNLLRDTQSFGANGQANFTSGGVIQAEKYDGFTVRGAGNAADSALTLLSYSGSWEAGQDYMVSFWAKGSGLVNAVMSNYGFPCASTASTGQIGTDNGGSVKLNMTAEWTRYWVRFTMGAWSDATASKALILSIMGHSTAYLCGVKLEKGTRATDWTPAPEDFS